MHDTFISFSYLKPHLLNLFNPLFRLVAVRALLVRVLPQVRGERAEERLLRDRHRLQEGVHGEVRHLRRIKHP